MSKLFSPIQLRELPLSNRVVVSPMCQYSALDGAMQEWHRIHLGQMAQSGAGLVMVEASSPTPEGRITHGCVGLWDDRTEAAMASVLHSLRAGQIIGLDQGGWQTWGPSAIAHMEGETIPHELSVAQLKSLTEAFLSTVARADRLGFDAIELHAAHGYLLHEFLSPIANQRQDAYGGSLENRMRFPLQLFTAMRAAWPAHKPMGLRLSATDWVEGSGWDIADACEFARRLEYLGADWIDVSSGGVSRAQQIKLGPGYQVPFAQAIKAVVKIPVIAVGLITEAKQAESILENNQADMVALGRGFLWDPHWAWKAAAELGASIAAPRQYWRSNPAQYKDVFGSIRFGAR
ncbi:MAG: NADH:flavin oxidoreductase/NADH oxidase [Betaproteobacteria bacterium]|nr:NADH:flavin oxidoreductase/NADH oxidase [Betaproteobacteria bacterium]